MAAQTGLADPSLVTVAATHTAQALSVSVPVDSSEHATLGAEHCLGGLGRRLVVIVLDLLDATLVVLRLLHLAVVAVVAVIVTRLLKLFARQHALHLCGISEMTARRQRII